MVKRPLLSVRAVRLTPPATDVAVTLAFSIGALSGPSMRPRMTSTCWAVAWLAVAMMARIAATTIDRMRRDTGTGWRREVRHTGIDARLDTRGREKGAMRYTCR